MVFGLLKPIADVISFIVTFVLLFREVKSHKVQENDEVEGYTSRDIILLMIYFKY